MILSRRLRWSSQAIGIGRRELEPFSARQFSSVVQYTPFRPNPLLSKRALSVSRTHTKSPQFSKTNSLIRNGASVRFASSTPAVVAAPKIPTPAEAVPSSASPTDIYPSSLQDATDFSVNSLYDMPERIGYLKNLGLDYGWGPTAMMEWTLEHVHVYAGSPWWLSIILTTVLVRVIMFKGYMMASDNAARMAVVRPLTLPLTKEMTAAQLTKDHEKVFELRREIQAMNSRAGVKIWRGFVPMLQVFTGYGLWVCLRGMSKLPVPGLETGGILWFQNLTVPDPFFLLPAVTSLVLHWVLRKGGETGASTMSPQATKILMIGFPALSFAFTFWLPAAVQVSFMATGILSYFQMEIFRNEKLRERLGMYPLEARRPPGASSSPYQGAINIKPRPAALTQAELNQTYAEPSAQFKAGQQPLRDMSPPGILGGAIKDIKGTFSSAKEGVSEARKMATEQFEGRKKKAERDSVLAYEKKRQKEVAAAEREMERQRRAIRASKKAKRS